MNALFWGTIIVLFGLSVLFEAIFGINVPFLRIFFGIWIIYFGASILTGQRSWFYCNNKYEHNSSFSNQSMKPTSLNSKYTNTFGNLTLDLSSLTLNTATKTNVRTTFGNTEIILSPQIPTLIIAKASMGSITFPDETMITMGRHTYKNYSDDQEPLLIIYLKVVFGTIKIESH